jgi:small-conductance mechanosensitive channel
VWIANYEGGGDAETALRTVILARFQEEGIDMPFPQRDIHIRTAPTPVAPPANGNSK